jgi:predicted nucleotidyltransferase
MKQAVAYGELGLVQEVMPARESVLKALAYFDIFHYPLTEEEIGSFLDRQSAKNELATLLTSLVADKIIFLHNGVYSLQDNPLLSYRRYQGNQRAETMLLKAQRIGRFLYQFPFVRAVGVSGSLSKNYADEKADIDFFIITKTNRLWIARTLMHLFKKLTFLTGRQRLYCMNYYIDEEALQLADQNIFTAIEIKTVVPVAGEDTMNVFFKMNNWADTWLPACGQQLQKEKDKRTGLLKLMMEGLLNNKVGDKIDDLFFRLTSTRWKRKERNGKRNEKGIRMGLLTDKHFAKSNPGDFQEKVLSLYRQRVDAINMLSTAAELTVSSATL